MDGDGDLLCNSDIFLSFFFTKPQLCYDCPLYFFLSLLVALMELLGLTLDPTVGLFN